MASHGHTINGVKSNEYHIWVEMRGRCRRLTHRKYKDYGARGIKICSRWGYYPNFLEDMGTKPSKGYSLDRIDNDSNYSCGHCEECIANGWTANCRWATAKEQANNRRPHKNRTGYAGVATRGKQFVAQIWVKGKYYDLGNYATAEQANRIFQISKKFRDTF